MSTQHTLQNNQDCPNRSELTSFLCGQITSRWLASHLQTCSHCQQEAYRVYLLMNASNEQSKAPYWQPRCQIQAQSIMGEVKSLSML